jgi:twitching motility protein PilT
MLAESLRGVVAQKLLRTADGKSRVAAVEVMICTPAIQNLIREAKTYQIPSVMQTGRNMGMQVMEDHIKTLLEKGVIDEDEAGQHLNRAEG